MTKYGWICVYSKLSLIFLSPNGLSFHPCSFSPAESDWIRKCFTHLSSVTGRPAWRWRWDVCWMGRKLGNYYDVLFGNVVTNLLTTISAFTCTTKHECKSWQISINDFPPPLPYSAYILPGVSFFHFTAHFTHLSKRLVVTSLPLIYLLSDSFVAFQILSLSRRTRRWLSGYLAQWTNPPPAGGQNPWLHHV